MSSLLVNIVAVDEIRPHPDPETTALEMAIVKGWQCVVKKDSLKAGDLCVYFPLDSILPFHVSEAIGVTKYLSKGRVRAARLRGQPSYGLLWPVEHFTKYIYDRDHTKPLWTARVFEEGEDVAELLGVSKWEPPLKLNALDAETPHPLFFTYTEIENMRNFPDIIQDGEEVLISEKIHGSNTRMAYIDGTYMAGSHNVRLKESPDCKYWYVMSEQIRELLKDVSHMGSVILYGETFGFKVQDLHYGMKQGEIGYRAFDLSVNGRYMNYQDFERVCDKHGVQKVPLLYFGPYSFDIIQKYADGDSVVEGADCMMEGVVVRPAIERTDPTVGRVILKYVFDRYLTRKGGTEDK